MINSFKEYEYTVLTPKDGYFGKLFSRSKQHQIGLTILRKALRKKSPIKIWAIVNMVSITVSFTSSWPNIVSQQSLRSFSCSTTSLKYLFSASSQLSIADSNITGDFSPGEDALLERL